MKKEQISKAILEEPFKFHLNVRGFLRIFGTRKVTLKIYPIHYGTMVKISGQLEKLHMIDPERLEKQPIFESIANYGKNGKLVSKLIAYGVLNSTFKIFLFSGILSRFLYEYLDGESGLILTTEIVSRAKIKAFQSTIIFLLGLDVLEPNLKEMSRNTTGETIAPGE